MASIIFTDSASEVGNSFTIAVQSSTAIYGVNVALGASCFYLLKSTTQLRKDRLTKVMTLLLYVCGMLGFASQAIVHVSQLMLGEGGHFSSGTQSPAGTSIWGGPRQLPLALPIVILGADMFMMWRCFVLYQGLSALKRVITSIFLGVLALASFGSGIYFLAGYYSPYELVTQDGGYDNFKTINGSKRNRSILLLLSITAATNISTSFLITARLLYAHKMLRESFPAAKSPYLSALALCIESSGLVTVSAILLMAFVVIDKPRKGLQAMTAIFPQICVLSPLLILYRISFGRETSITRAEEVLRTRSISFAQQTITSTV